MGIGRPKKHLNNVELSDVGDALQDITRTFRNIALICERISTACQQVSTAQGSLIKRHRPLDFQDLCHHLKEWNDDIGRQMEVATVKTFELGQLTLECASGLHHSFLTLCKKQIEGFLQEQYEVPFRVRLQRA